MKSRLLIGFAAGVGAGVGTTLYYGIDWGRSLFVGLIVFLVFACLPAGLLSGAFRTRRNTDAPG
jgi:hypothetical protein